MYILPCRCIRCIEQNARALKSNTIDAVIRRWCKTKSDDTARQYLHSVQPFRAWLLPRDLVQARRSDIERYFRTAKLTQWSQRRVVTALRSLFKELRRQGLCSHDPTSSVAVLRPRFARTPRYRAIVRAAGEHA